MERKVRAGVFSGWGRMGRGSRVGGGWVGKR